MKTIVVGVDGSKCAQAALEQAAEEAACRRARMVIVVAWEMPESAFIVAPAAPGILDSFREEAESIAQRAAARVRELQPSVVLKPGH